MNVEDYLLMHPVGKYNVRASHAEDIDDFITWIYGEIYRMVRKFWQANVNLFMLI